MKVFLDIDGVMVHGNPNKRVEMAEDGFYVFLNEAVTIFNTISVDEIILSTSHKNRFTLEQWNELLKNRGLQFDKVSRIESEPLTRSRREEIMWWITKMRYDTKEIIIIDDDKTLNGLAPFLKERVVLTSSFRGLCNSDIPSVLSITSKSTTYQILNTTNNVAEDTVEYK